jgi:hypothetical protein
MNSTGLIMKQTFKQYLEGKEQLRNAVNSVPVTIIEYEVRKYCTLTVGDNSEESSTVQLKPKQRLSIKWVYNNPKQPIPEYIKVDSGNILTESEDYTTFWGTEKLQKWLARHTHEKVNYGHEE